MGSENSGKVCILGSGLIGHQWAMIFASGGFKVNKQTNKHSWLSLVERTKKYVTKQGVINDPICQTHNSTSSDHYTWKLVCFARLWKWGRTDDICENSDHYRPWLLLGQVDQYSCSYGIFTYVRDQIDPLGRSQFWPGLIIMFAYVIRLSVHIFQNQAMAEWIIDGYCIVDSLGWPSVTQIKQNKQIFKFK